MNKIRHRRGFCRASLLLRYMMTIIIRLEVDADKEEQVISDILKVLSNLGVDTDTIELEVRDAESIPDIDK